MVSVPPPLAGVAAPPSLHQPLPNSPHIAANCSALPGTANCYVKLVNGALELWTMASPVGEPGGVAPMAFLTFSYTHYGYNKDAIPDNTLLLSRMNEIAVREGRSLVDCLTNVNTFSLV